MRNSTKFRLYQTLNGSRRKEWQEIRGKVLSRRYVATQDYHSVDGDFMWRLVAYFPDVKEPVTLKLFDTLDALHAFLGYVPPKQKEHVK